MIDWNEPVSLVELRRVIRYRRGWRSLLNSLEARELLRGARFVLRTRGRGLTRYRASLALLAEHAPDLLPADLRGDHTTSQQPVDGTDLKRMRTAMHLLDERIEEAVLDLLERRVFPRLSNLEKKSRLITRREVPVITRPAPCREEVQPREKHRQSVAPAATGTDRQSEC